MSQSPACVTGKILIAGATPQDPNNEVRPFKVAACEATKAQLDAWERSVGVGTRYELVVTPKEGKPFSRLARNQEELHRLKAEEIDKPDTRKVEEVIHMRTGREVVKSAGPNHPAGNVFESDAKAYCAAQLDEKKMPGRLPTPDEWMKMAAGRDGRYGSTGWVKCKRNAQCDAKVAKVVGSFQPNNFGVFDVIGNVAEAVETSGGRIYWVGGSYQWDAVATNFGAQRYSTNDGTPVKKWDGRRWQEAQEDTIHKGFHYGSREGTRPVGQAKGSYLHYGWEEDREVYDFHGNVWEWTYRPKHAIELSSGLIDGSAKWRREAQKILRLPSQGPASGEFIAKGYAWNNTRLELIEIEDSVSFHRASRSNDIGFRCGVSPD